MVKAGYDPDVERWLIYGKAKTFGKAGSHWTVNSRRIAARCLGLVHIYRAVEHGNMPEMDINVVQP